MAASTPRLLHGLIFASLAIPGCGLHTDHVCTAYMEGVVEAAQYNEFEISTGDTGTTGFDVWSYPDTLCDCPPEAELETMSRDDAFELGWANFCAQMKAYDSTCKGVEAARANIKFTGVDGKSPSLAKAFWSGKSGHGYDSNKTCQKFAQGIADADGDGFGGLADCDDSDATIHPEAVETCDGIDNDCDGRIDDSDDTVSETTIWFVDTDGDGAGTNAETIARCTMPNGFAPAPNDCDDTNPSVYEGADEVCDGLDNDCDGPLSPDEVDHDGDGFVECTPEGAWAGAADMEFGDCDDTEATTYPGAEDSWYDGVDSDCAEDSDFDADGDGYDSTDYGGSDCDDANTQVRPDAVDGLLYDLNCDGTAAGGSLSSSEYVLEYSGFIPRISGTGDFDGGGRADFVVSLNGYPDSGEQSAHLFLGEALDTDRDVDVSSPDLAIVNDLTSDSFGYLLATGGGDVDGDGLGDILLGEQGVNLAAENGGGAFVILGRSIDSNQSMNLSAADHWILSYVDDWAAGTNVAFAGDVDGDARTDLLIGANGSGGLQQSVHLVLATELGETPTNLVNSTYVIEDRGYFDNEMATAGDVDGDGLDDFMLGSNWDAALLYLADDLGSPGTLSLTDASVTFESLRCAGSGDGLSSALAPAGDVDDDGRADILLGAMYDCDGGTQAGAAFLVFGNNLTSGQTVSPTDVGAKLTGTGSYQGAGGSVASAGDVDGDGTPDILVGTELLTSSAYGKAWLLFGAGIRDGSTYDLANADRILTSDFAYDGTGQVTELGDMNGDTRSDVLVASESNVWLMLSSPR